MKKIAIFIIALILIGLISISGCTQQRANDNNDIDDINDNKNNNVVVPSYFYISGVIKNNYSEDLELDMGILVDDFEWLVYETKFIGESSTRSYKLQVKTGYPVYSYRLQVYSRDNIPGDYLDDFTFTNPSGNDMEYIVTIDSNGIIKLSKQF
jgi:hypothetical protein